MAGEPRSAGQNPAALRLRFRVVAADAAAPLMINCSFARTVFMSPQPSPDEFAALPQPEAVGALALAIATRDFDAARQAAPDATRKELQRAGDALMKLAHLWRHNATSGPGEAGREEGERRLLGLAQTAAAIAREPRAQLSAQSFLFLSFSKSEFHPSSNEAMVAAMTAEAGAAAPPLDPQRVKLVQWRAVSSVACERVATAFSRAGGFSPFEGSPNGSWITMAWAFLAVNKTGALLALIREAKGSPHETLMTSAEGLIARRHAMMQGHVAAGEGKTEHAWKKAMRSAFEAGMPAGAPTLAQIAMAGALRQEMAKQKTQTQQTRSDLDWARETFNMGPKDLAEFFTGVCHGRTGPSRPGYPGWRSAPEFDRALSDAAAWAVERGMEPTDQAWRAAAENGDPCFMLILLGSRHKWTPPDATLAQAAATAEAERRDREGNAPAIVAALLASRPWSPDLVGKALVEAATQGAPEIAFQPPLSVQPATNEHRERAILALSGRALGGADKNGAIARAIESWTQAGADPKGPKGDGDPLRQALKHGNWALAESLAKAGGWGPQTFKWLARPRKGDEPELAQWIARGKAIQEKAALRKTLAAVARRHKTKDQTQENGAISAPSSPALANRTAKSARRL